MTPDALDTQAGAGVFAMWRARNDYSAWPYAGGWANQPLDLLSQFRALDLIEQTWRIWRSGNDAAVEKFTPLQADLIRWLEENRNE